MMRRQYHSEHGFTLIELLVVVVIIGILSSIAIPTFLKQREKAWDKAVSSDLRNNALKMDEYYEDFGTYPGSAPTGTYAFRTSDNTQPTTVLSANRSGFCLQAVSTRTYSGNRLVWDSAVGRALEPTDPDACTAASYVP